MSQTENSKKYDLEIRCYRFARGCRDFAGQIPKITPNLEYIKQLIRSSASVAANYIEANESLSRKDFVHRIMICRKEAKESLLWLKLIEANDNKHSKIKQTELIGESIELRKIFGSIVEKCK